MDFDGTVDEDAAGLAVASGGESLSDRLGVLLIEHGPEDDRRRRGPFPDELAEEVLRDQILGDEPA